MAEPCFQSQLEEFPFDQDEVADIWKLAREEFIDKTPLGETPNFDSIVKGVSERTGLDERFVIQAFTKPKAIRQITNEMWSKLNARRAVVQRAKYAVAAIDTPDFVNKLAAVYNAPRAILVAGHWGVFPVTHAGDLMFDPKTTKTYLQTVKRAWMDSNKTDYEKLMHEMVRDPAYIWARRGSPSVDPRTPPVGILNKTVKEGKLSKSAMGFDMLKPLRLELFKREWSRVVAEDWKGQIPDMKEATQTARSIMAVIDHATGEIRLSPFASKWLARGLFAPKLLPARWMGGLIDPIKAATTYSRWSKASAGERAAARFVARRTIRTLATYHLALAVNEGINQWAGSKDHVNFTDPTRADFLRFKILGHTVYYPSGIMEPFRLFAAMVGSAYKPVRQLRQQTREQALIEPVVRYGMGKIHPALGLVPETMLGQEHYTGRKLPSPLSDMPWQPYTRPSPLRPQIGWGEFLGSKAPIPLAGGVREFYDMMRHEGMSETDAMAYLRAALSAGIEVTGWQAPPFREPVKRTPMGQPREPSEPGAKYQ